MNDQEDLAQTVLALIIEDDPNLREIYRRVLTDLDVTVIEAVDGEQALQRLQQYTPHLIILDILLPYIRGTELLPLIFENAKFADTHVVVVSSNKQSASVTRQYPSVHFILKPIRVAQIREIVEAVLQQISS
jgi:CheY-like chemotaxis protein